MTATTAVRRQEDPVARTRRGKRQTPFQRPDAVLDQAQRARLRAELGKPALCHHVSKGVPTKRIQPVEIQRQPVVEPQERGIGNGSLIDATQPGDPADDQRIRFDHHESRTRGAGMLSRGKKPQQLRWRQAVGDSEPFQEAIKRFPLVQCWSTRQQASCSHSRPRLRFQRCGTASARRPTAAQFSALTDDWCCQNDSRRSASRSTHHQRNVLLVGH